MKNFISKWRLLASVFGKKVVTRGQLRSRISNKSQISIFFKSRQTIPKNEAY